MEGMERGGEEGTRPGREFLMSDELEKWIISISPAPGWRVLYGMKNDDGSVEPLVEHAAYFALVETMDFPEAVRGDGVNRFVELHTEAAEGFFEDSADRRDFIKYLSPGVDLTDEDRKEVEAHFAERERVRKLMLEEDARKKAQEPPEEGKDEKGAA